MKRPLLIALLAASLLCNVGFAIQGTPKPQQWEYKIEFNVNEKKLNALAAQGWELVAASPEASVSNVTGFYFRRPKQ